MVDSLAARRPVYRRHRARDPAPALFALLHPRHEEDRPCRHRRAVSRACSRKAWWCTRPTRTRPAAGFCRATCASSRTGAARKAFHVATGAPIEIGSIEKMSKSKKNTVDPDEIIASYGADTARWFMLSDSPPERDVIWTEEGVQGADRFVQRVWRLVAELADRTAQRRGRTRRRPARPRRPQGGPQGSGGGRRGCGAAAVQPLRGASLRARQQPARSARTIGRQRPRPVLRTHSARPAGSSSSSSHR